MGTWLLPEDLADILPAEARRIEELRRTLLDLYRSYGYELVMPPLVEYLDSLLSGAGSDLNLRTFKLVDQMSGRTLGVRADMTPQVTRIDAHLLNRAGVTRLCYCGSVLHTRAAGFTATREPLQIGAELYGHTGLEADVEILRLALASVQAAGLHGARVDLGHAGLVRAILDADPAAAGATETLCDLMSAKDEPGLAPWFAALRPDTTEALRRLLRLYGDASVLEEARAVLPALPGVTSALDTLQALARALPAEAVSLDLADARDYHYHTGAVFALYVDGWPDTVVRGGRYDDVGRAFGRARPATGFSLDLRVLAGLLAPATSVPAIQAPWGEQPDLMQAIAELREAGNIVVQSLPGREPDQQEYAFDRELVLGERGWQVVVRR
ncbi:ATP phosphoribosyltransferase regulatory subunit [Achromobacter sp. GG226]|uniref:ATP phosphoribosyltransferase regulatory subunit n=1 Tax=Verticiella alkaliphila TaxID=2779529 RepID=UPI001C0B009C|nr:ATP phosphoribosyltransferase regulatory subunit [Verticiella sp. GG226]MBU4612593.1 ATP phosphoribosyltransferase regulatory subunit [Verticiella sp. GG226]